MSCPTRKIRIVVTGAKGYIGSALCHVLKRDFEHTVLPLDIANGRAEDITDSDCQSFIQDWRPDLIINLAGVSGENEAQGIGADRVFEVNARAPVALRKLCPEAAFVQASTCSIYDGKAVKSIYANSKVTAEAGLFRPFEVEQESLVVFRFGTVFGPNPYGKMRWDLPVNKMAFDAVDSRVIRIPRYRLDRPWVPICELLEIIERVVADVAYGMPLKANHPLPVVAFNFTLEQFARNIAEMTKARIEYLDAHKDNRTYAISPTAGGHEFMDHAWMVTNKLIEMAYEHSLAQAGGVDRQVPTGGAEEQAPDNGPDGGEAEGGPCDSLRGGS